MSDEPLAQKPFGRNQKIAVSFLSIPYLMNYALVLSGKLEGATFWTGSIAYVTLGLGAILGGAAFVKSKWGGGNG